MLSTENYHKEKTELQEKFETHNERRENTGKILYANFHAAYKADCSERAWFVESFVKSHGF